ncbi:hypothetical protein [Nostoc sp. CHAB 5715]|uniref:hypothetical protein n=1 Tax=Nostoc sp. CHAB 5715 TaxID=2780400 RepID=UPI001E43AD6A|nr:hypothetical protein [Nostoc sp. CHAB 5715]
MSLDSPSGFGSCFKSGNPPNALPHRCSVYALYQFNSCVRPTALLLKETHSRSGILRQALAKPSLLCLIKASLLNSYIKFGQSLIEFGQSLIEFGQSFIEFGQSFIEFGQSFIEFGQSFIEFGQSFIEFGQSFIEFGQSFIEFGLIQIRW